MNHLAPRISRESLLTLEAYAKVRTSSRPEAIAYRRLRSVVLGTHMRLQFEDVRTVRRQIQEMLIIERVYDDEAIQAEIDAYAALVPDGTNWKATVLLEYPDLHERQRALAQLIGVEDRLFVEVHEHGRVSAIADEDLTRENHQKTSAVHFVRFEFSEAQRHAVHAGAPVSLGCDHTDYAMQADIPADTLACLAGDLR